MRFVDTSRIRSRFDERVPMRDGVELSADVYRPARPGRYPVLLTRTPYDNNRSPRPTGSTGLGTTTAPADRYKIIAAHGFIVVAGDVRGRGDSDGDFVPFENEGSDGADLATWASALPDSDGRLGLFGAGYAGFTALVAAAHPAVTAIAVWSPFGAGGGLPGAGGAARLDWLLWLHLVGGRTLQPADVPPWPKILRHRPLATMHEALGRPGAPWRDWVERAQAGPGSWPALRLDEILARSAAPMLLVTGWWDAGLMAAARYWDLARASSAHRRHRLLIGPWDARSVRTPRLETGGVAWGPGSVADHDELLIDWFEGQLRGRGRPAAGVRVFVTGRNEWADLAEWPPTGTSTTLWLTSGGAANTRRGDGRLVRDGPVDGGRPDRFTHDPDNPVPWQPGHRPFTRSGRAADLTLDTSFATTRDDTLVYTSPPVAASMTISGRGRVRLWAETDAADADWVVGIEDVFPCDGRSVHLAHGIVRARTVAAFAPGSPTVFEIPLTAVAHELLPGHSLRLVVASSLFPLYAVNLGTTDYLHGREPVLARQTIHHNMTYPSLVELPVVKPPGAGGGR
jgi:putative CocE/NonD family hydrolase